MEPNYLAIFNYVTGEVDFIRLTAEELEESEKYDEMGDFIVEVLSPKYNLNLNLEEISWMATESLCINNHGF